MHALLSTSWSQVPTRMRCRALPHWLWPALPYRTVTCTALLWCYLHSPIVVLPALPDCGVTCTALLWCWAPTHRGVNCTAPPCCYLLWPTVLLPALPHPVLPALPHRSATCMAPLCCYLHCPTGYYLHCPTRCYLHCHTPSSPMILTCRPSLCSLDVYIWASKGGSGTEAGVSRVS